MKSVLLLILAALTVTACSQPKDIYFNGTEGSHSGLKYDKDTKSFGINP